MSGTHLFYNGVLLRDCEMKQWRQDIIRDESDTDVLYSKVTLSVESMLVSLHGSGPSAAPPPYYAGGFNAPWSSIAVPVVDHETVVDRWREIQWRLQESRKDFWLALNGTTSQRQPGRVVPPGSPPGTDSQPPVPADDGYFNDSYRVVLAATGLSTDDLDQIAKKPEADANTLLGFLEGFSESGNGNPKTKILRNQVIDLNNGPKPINVSVEQVFGGRALRVSFTIEVCRCFCRPTQLTSNDTPPVQDSTKVKGVISNRWSLTESLDAQWRTSHEIEGKLVVADVRYKPHAMRLLVTPVAIPYARLESRSFATDRTGLALAYRLSFKETGPASPPGVVDWDATYTERSALGGKKLGDISVRVTGQVNPVNGSDPDPHRTHKSHLVAIACRIAKSRINFENPFVGPLNRGEEPSVVVTDAVVVEHMSKPTIELRLSALFHDKAPAGEIVSDRFGLRLKNMGASLAEVINQYDPRWWPLPSTLPWDVDSAVEAAAADETGTFYDCYFQSPCSEWHSMPRGAAPPEDAPRDEQATEGAVSGGGGTASPTSSQFAIAIDPALSASLNDPADPPAGVPIPSSQHGWSNDQANFAYIQADIDTQYNIGSGSVQLPLSKQRSFSAGVPGESSIVVQLHAGVAQRVITMVATRLGKWPQVPAPRAQLQTDMVVEKFLDGTMLNHTPKLTKDGRLFVYSTQIKWVYALSRVPTTGDSIRAASSPMDKTTPDTNKIALTDYFTDGLIESIS